MLRNKNKIDDLGKYFDKELVYFPQTGLTVVIHS